MLIELDPVDDGTFIIDKPVEIDVLAMSLRSKKLGVERLFNSPLRHLKQTFQKHLSTA